MSMLLRSLMILTIVAAATIAALAWACLDERAEVSFTGRFDPQSVQRARAILRQHDPRRARGEGLRRLELRVEDLDLLLDHAIARFTRGGARLHVEADRLHLLLSMQTPAPLQRFVNLRAVLEQRDDGLPRLTDLQIGRLSVPVWLARLAVRVASAVVPELDEDLELLELVRQVEIDGPTLRVSYEWRETVMTRLRARLLDDAVRERVRAYHERLLEVTRELDWGSSVSQLLQVMFETARLRSSAADADPVAENRALLVVLATYGSRGGLTSLVPDAAAWPRPPPRRLRLHGRFDLARHYLVSAGLTALGGGTLADAIGVFKEVDDAGVGSGFSFADIAANRAGSRLGEIATESRQLARRTQRWLAQGLADVDLAPDPAGLPDKLSEAEFRRRYESVDSAAYRAVLADVEQHIEALALYRESSF